MLTGWLIFGLVGLVLFYIGNPTHFNRYDFKTILMILFICIFSGVITFGGAIIYLIFSRK